jgi:hypothetical protein
MMVNPDRSRGFDGLMMMLMVVVVVLERTWYGIFTVFFLVSNFYNYD